MQSDDTLDLRSNTGRLIFNPRGMIHGFQLYDLSTMRDVSPKGTEIVAGPEQAEFSLNDERLFVTSNGRLLVFTPPSGGGNWQPVNDPAPIPIPALSGNKDEKVAGLLALDDKDLVVVSSSGVISIYTGKRIVVIGSGATAITLVPAMAQRAAHVTMLQRSPSYVISRPAEDQIANWLRRSLPERAAYVLARWKNVWTATFFYSLARKRPELFKWMVAKGVRKELGDKYDSKHFTPPYNPWDQRLCSRLTPTSLRLYATVAFQW